MSTTAWLARLLSVGGVLETLAGAALLIDPARVASLLLGASLQGPAITIARLGGGGLLALGIACWCARTTPAAPASIGVGWGFLAYNLVACATLASFTLTTTSGSLPALGAAVLHGVLGATLLWALLGRAR